MKKFLLLTAITIGLVGANRIQAANTNFAVLSLSATVISQSTNTTTTTNSSGVVTYTQRLVTNAISNADVLKMLETEYGTTFPVGAKLVYDVTGGTSSIDVVSSNFVVLQDVSANLSFTNMSLPSAAAIRYVNNPATTNSTVAFSFVTADAGMRYVDSHGNNFHILGFETYILNESFTATNANTSLFTATVNGAGGGTLVVKSKHEQVTGIFSRGIVTAIGRNLKGGSL